MKKRTTVGVALMCGLVLALALPGFALAEEQGDKGSVKCGARLSFAVSQGVVYVDANGDGICDYCPQGNGGSGGNGAGPVDANGDGVCDNYPRAGGGADDYGQGTGFIDANGDGICDNRGTGPGRGGSMNAGARR